ncbi:MAG: Mrp/NBP35 family ATP-binding protein [Acidimicrobiia bacterium]|nr:Mrp/NBP35 family ATP-binding protein [Acidimicrobiia bacterium]
MTTVTDRTLPIWEALQGVLDPELGESVVDLGMIKGVRLESGVATIKVALTIAACPLRDQIEGDVVRKIESLEQVDSAVVEITAMSQDERTELMERVRLRARENAGATRVHPTTRVIAVSSGKGGVGKSSVSVNLALALNDLGHKVGLLDADIWGFSIPRMVGARDASLSAGADRVIEPAEALGISVVSTGLIVDDEETALMWRGLMLSKALEQFLRDVGWAPDLDYLIIDMPPGTGDVQMALARLLPQAEMVVVTTPQKAAQKVASRVADMARRSHMPVIGVIENMSGFTAKDGERYDLFGVGGGTELAHDLGVPLLGEVPLDPEVVSGGDEGAPVVRAHPESPAAGAFSAIAKTLTEIVPPASDDSCTSRIAILEEQLKQLDLRSN